MGKCIYGNTVGVGGGLPKSFLLETEDGVQLVGVTVGEEVVFDATPNDVREGKIYAGEDGVKTGEKIIPSYHTVSGIKVVGANSQLVLTNLSTNVDNYDYTELQTIVCAYNTNLSNSVSAEQVCIDSKMYNVKSVEALSTVKKDHENKTIDLGVMNESSKPCLIRFFTYKEIE